MQNFKTTVVLFITLFILAGCFTGRDIIFDESDRGADPEQLMDAADQQDESIGIITAEATNVYANATKTTTKKSAIKIIDETKKIQPISSLLRAEAESNEKIKALQERCVMLQKKIDSGEARLMLWLKIIGIVLIPTGIVLGIKLSRDLFVLTLAGVVLMVATQIDAFIVQYGMWLLGALTLVLGIAGFRMYIVQRRSLIGAIQVGEALKEVVKEKDPSLVEQMFGKGTRPGTVRHDAGTERQILSARKIVQKIAKPVG